MHNSRSDAAGPRGRRAILLAAMVSAILCGTSPASANGWLGTLRDDVRTSDPAPPPKKKKKKDGDTHFHFTYNDCDCDDCDDDGGLSELAFWFGAYTITSPIWGPCAAVGDDYSVEYTFPRFPYGGGRPGYMRIPVDAEPGRRFAGRLRVDYADNFDDLERIGGRLLLSTSTRFGLDTGMSRFEESLHGGAYDHLWLGNLNVVYRFAQSPRSQWRIGLGMNWLDDPIDTDYGFNFTYGFDFFPRRPWVFSTEIDWGTLGHAELFHFRTTAGAILGPVESYVGYEYWDIDRAQSNALLAGVRVWF